MMTHTQLHRRKGLTLIELMVSTTIIVILVLAVGQIIAQAGRVVSIGQAGIRSNGKIAALRSVIRNDLRRTSKMGMLYLDAQGHLVVTTAGTADSLVGDTTGTGSLIGYGLRNYTNADPGHQALCRVGLILNSKTGSLTGTDSAAYDFTSIQGLAGVNPTMFVNSLLTGYFPNTPMDVMQKDLDATDITQESWKLMAARVKEIEIFWTDGTRNAGNNLNWYGGKGGLAKGAGLTAGTETGAGAAYSARWTNANPNEWPKAIKVLITIADDSMADYQGLYEVICPIGQ